MTSLDRVRFGYAGDLGGPCALDVADFGESDRSGYLKAVDLALKIRLCAPRYQRANTQRRLLVDWKANAGLKCDKSRICSDGDELRMKAHHQQ